MENDRKFLGIWIPAEVWLDHSISIIERALFAEIHSLDGPRGCFASNEYFAENFGVTMATISKGIARLKETGYIEQVSFDGRRRILRSLLSFERQPSKKLKADLNDFDDSIQDFSRQSSNPLKHIEKKITKIDNKDYEGDAPVHFGDAVKASKGRPVIDFVPESLTEVEITGPDAPKSKRSAPAKKNGETMLADVYTREGFIEAWGWTPFAKARTATVDAGRLYDVMEAWSTGKGERRKDWLAAGRTFVLGAEGKGKPGEFAPQKQTMVQQMEAQGVEMSVGQKQLVDIADAQRQANIAHREKMALLFGSNNQPTE